MASPFDQLMGQGVEQDLYREVLIVAEEIENGARRCTIEARADRFLFTHASSALIPAYHLARSMARASLQA